MFLSQLFFSVVLFRSVLAQTTNYTALSELPKCVITCSTLIIEPSGCQYSDLNNCLCRNSTLQYDLGVCVANSCDLSEQIVASTITEKYICNGVPIESRSEEIVRNSIIIAAVTFPTIGLRFISRMMVARKLWWDDWVILGAGVLMIFNTFSPIYSAYYGFGKHFYNISPENSPLLLKIFYASSIVYFMLQSLPKISICFLYIRIFPSPTFNRIVKGVLAFTVLQATIFCFLCIFQCTPIDASWDIQKRLVCIHSGPIQLQKGVLVGGCLSIVIDLVLMFLPIMELRKLNMSLRQKVSLALMFGIGSFGCVAAMIRLKYIVKYFYTSYDTSWDNTDVVLWSDIETYSGVICACLVCIRPLFVTLIPSLFRSAKTASTHPYSPSAGSKKPFAIKNTYFREKEASRNAASSSEKGFVSDKQSFGSETEMTGNISTFHLQDDEIQVTIENRVSYQKGGESVEAAAVDRRSGKGPILSDLEKGYKSGFRGSVIPQTKWPEESEEDSRRN